MYIKPDFNGIFLNLTDECNLRCRYCFVAKHPHYMTLQTAKDAINMLVEIYDRDPKKRIKQV